MTPFEAELSQRAVGLSAVTTQADAMKAFGRTLGQGAMEVPVALQTAIANAALDSFTKNFPKAFLSATEQVPGNIGRQLGGVIDVDGVAVSLLAVVNATEGGLGPNEDVEGNVNLAGKAALMKRLGLDHLPTILLEGKVYSEPISSEITEPTFVTRAFPGDDNVTVSECLEASAQQLGYPILYPRELLARKKGAMRELTRQMGERLEALARQFSAAETSAEKVRLAAEINRFVSEDLGGVRAIPGTTGCLSLFVPTAENKRSVYPALTLADVNRFADVVLGAVALLHERREDAVKEVAAAAARAVGHGLTVKG